jgi:hypothetical protein
MTGRRPRHAVLGTGIVPHEVPPLVVFPSMALLTMCVLVGAPIEWVMSVFTGMLCLWYRALKLSGARAVRQAQLARQLAGFDEAAAAALAVTLEASTRTSQTDLRRLQILAASVAHASGVTESETAKLDADALMQDVGTLAPLERVHTAPSATRRS